MKKYFAKIIATDNEGLRMISACCSGAKVKISNMINGLFWIQLKMIVMAIPHMIIMLVIE